MGLVGVDAQYAFGDEAYENHHGDDDVESQFGASLHKGNDRVGLALSHQVASQRAGGSGYGIDGHKEERRHVADDVRNSQLAFAQMLYSQEEKEPCAQREEIL